MREATEMIGASVLDTSLDEHEVLEATLPVNWP